MGLNKFIEKFQVVSSTDDVHAKRKRFVMHVVQPGLEGLMDGSVSTLAPVFAAAASSKASSDCAAAMCSGQRRFSRPGSRHQHRAFSSFIGRHLKSFLSLCQTVSPGFSHSLRRCRRTPNAHRRPRNHTRTPVMYIQPVYYLDPCSSR